MRGWGVCQMYVGEGKKFGLQSGQKSFEVDETYNRYNPWSVTDLGIKESKKLFFFYYTGFPRYSRLFMSKLNPQLPLQSCNEIKKLFSNLIFFWSANSQHRLIANEEELINSSQIYHLRVIHKWRHAIFGQYDPPSPHPSFYGPCHKNLYPLLLRQW